MLLFFTQKKRLTPSRYWGEVSFLSLLCFFYFSICLGLSGEEPPIEGESPEPPPSTSEVFIAEETYEEKALPPMELFIAFTEAHPEWVEAFTEKHGEALVVEIWPQLGKIFARVFFFTALLGAFFYGLSAWLVSLWLTPLRASLLHASLFAGVQLGVGLLFAGLSFFLGGFSLYLLWTVFGLVQFLSLVAATMYFYQTNVIKTLLFGAAGSFLYGIGFSGTVMGIGLVAPKFYLHLAGNDFANITAQQTIPYLNQEITEIQPHYQQLREEEEKNQAQLASLQTQQTAIQEKITTLEQQIETKQNGAELQYASIGLLLDSGRIDEAKKAYTSFQTTYADHPLAVHAQRELNLLEQKEAQTQAQRKEAQEKEKTAQKKALLTFQKKFQTNTATLSEIRRFVLGQSPEEVIALLGKPSDVQANVLIYTHRKALDPLRGKPRAFLVNLLQSRVQGVSYLGH